MGAMLRETVRGGLSRIAALHGSIRIRGRQRAHGRCNDGGLMHTPTRLSRFGLLTRSLILSAAATVVLLAQPAARAADSPPPKSNLVKITTNVGDIIIELLPDRAPLTVTNFLRYVKEGFYTNL